MSIILNFIGFNLTSEFNCNVSGRLGVSSINADEPNSAQAWFRCILASSWFAVSIASFLLALRGRVIHNHTLPTEIVG